MASRGRGRGGGRPVSINVEALGFGRGGDMLPTAMSQPPSLFPPLDQRPLPLQKGDTYNYLIDLKHDFQVFMEDSPYYLKRVESKTDIERYSDKYKTLSSSTSEENNMILWNRIPEELWQTRKSSTTAKRKKAAKHQLDTVAKLDKQENAEAGEQHKGSDDEAAVGSDDSDDQGGSDVEGEVDEEEMEEDNDYIHEYFDNGENFLDVDDDDDGPVY